MRTYEIEIKEFLSKTIEIQAVSAEEAIAKVKEMYRGEEIVLSADDFGGVKIKEYVMKDPRDILIKKLQKIGLSKNDATVITLDASSSQAIVNRTYLKESFKFSKELEAKILKKVKRFYSGAYNEY